MINHRMLEYIKTRIISGETRFTVCIYDSMFEVSSVNFSPKECNNSKLWVYEYNGKIISELYYDTNADFNYFTMNRSIKDGTFLFIQTSIKDVLNKVMSATTFNKKIINELPYDKDFFNCHHIKYTVGNIFCLEYNEEFATKEKPYLTSRYTALLPIEIEIVKD